MSIIPRQNDKHRQGWRSFMTSQVSYYVLLSVIKIVSHIPFKLLYVLSDIIFYPFYFIIRYRRKIVRKNLTESFPDKTIEEIRSIEVKFYHFLIDLALETCKLASISPNEIRKRVKFNNIELANNLLINGESISLFLGHYGNWELISSMGLWLYNGSISVQIYHRLRNKAMDKIMKALRERMGNICVERYKTTRFMAKALKDNRTCIIGFLADQSPKKRDVKYFINFLNHMIPVITGTEKATKYFGYKALFLSAKRVKRGYYECELSSLHNDPESLPDYELTDLYYKRLEREIMQHPEFYLWTHNRFKYARTL